MRSLILTDLHEDNPQAGEGPSSNAQRFARQVDADAIFYLGDPLYGVWATEDGENIYNARDEKSTVNDWIGDYKIVLDNLTDGDIPVLSIPGNHDGITDYSLGYKNHIPYGETLIEEQGDIIPIDKRKEEVEGFVIGGVGGCREIVEGGATPIEYTEEEIDRYLEEIGDVDILLTHTVPYGTSLDISERVFPNDEEEDMVYDGDRVVGVHVGSKSLRKYVDGYQLPIGVGGHIHESKGVDDIGNTKYANVSYEGNKIAGVIDTEKNDINIMEFDY